MDSEVKIGERVDLFGQTDEEKLIAMMEKSFDTRWKDVTINDDEYLDPTAPFNPPEFAITIRGVPVFAFDDFNYLSGLAGNGKSFTKLIYESVILGSRFGEVEYIGKRKKPRVLDIDTEQSKGNVQLHQVRLYHMVGWEQQSDHRDQYQILQLRDTPSAAERWAKIIKATIELKPDFVFVDGMLDTVKSMNDEEECSRIISEAGALASKLKLCEIGICHENESNSKSDEGPNKPAGHIGSFCQRKASAGQGTKKTKEEGQQAKFTVGPKKVRNDDYDGFTFMIKKEPIEIGGKTYHIAIPYWIDDIPISPEKRKEDEKRKKEEELKATIQTYMQNIQWNIEGLRYTDIETGLKEQGLTSGRKRSDYIVQAQQFGIISKNEANGMYYLVYQENANIDTQTSIENSNSMGDDDGTMPF